jgi:hypothetical protein
MKRSKKQKRGPVLAERSSKLCKPSLSIPSTAHLRHPSESEAMRLGTGDDFPVHNEPAFTRAEMDAMFLTLLDVLGKNRKYDDLLDAMAVIAIKGRVSNDFDKIMFRRRVRATAAHGVDAPQPTYPATLVEPQVLLLQSYCPFIPVPRDGVHGGYHWRPVRTPLTGRFPVRPDYYHGSPPFFPIAHFRIDLENRPLDRLYIPRHHVHMPEEPSYQPGYTRQLCDLPDLELVDRLLEYAKCLPASEETYSPTVPSVYRRIRDVLLSHRNDEFDYDVAQAVRAAYASWDEHGDLHDISFSSDMLEKLQRAFSLGGPQSYDTEAHQIALDVGFIDLMRLIIPDLMNWLTDPSLGSLESYPYGDLASL